jgi:hypothetical protein
LGNWSPTGPPGMVAAAEQVYLRTILLHSSSAS